MSAKVPSRDECVYALAKVGFKDPNSCCPQVFIWVSFTSFESGGFTFFWRAADSLFFTDRTLTFTLALL